MGREAAPIHPPCMHMLPAGTHRQVVEATTSGREKYGSLWRPQKREQQTNVIQHITIRLSKLASVCVVANWGNRWESILVKRGRGGGKVGMGVGWGGIYVFLGGANDANFGQGVRGRGRQLYRQQLRESLFRDAVDEYMNRHRGGYCFWFHVFWVCEWVLVLFDDSYLHQIWMVGCDLAYPVKRVVRWKMTATVCSHRCFTFLPSSYSDDLVVVCNWNRNIAYFTN